MSKVSKRAVANRCRALANWYENNPSKWVQFRFSTLDAEASYCLVGLHNRTDATNFYTGKVQYDEKVGLLGEKLFDAFRAVNGSHPMAFNDKKAKTVKDVIKALRKTARALDHGLSLE